MPPALRSRAGARADDGLQALWTACFAGLARLRPTHPRLWTPAGGARVLVVAPHPDDEVAGCAATLLRHRQAGDAVTVVVATDGRRSRAGGLAPAEMSATRRREAEVVAARLDVDLRWLGHAEGGWREDDLRAGLRALLGDAAPAVVYAPSAVDFHAEHVAVARCLAAAIAGMPAPLVRVYPIQVPLGPVLANLVSPVGALASEVAEAMVAYASQATSLHRCLRARAYCGARHGLPGPAEEFWEMDSEAYRRLHETPLAPAFRGLRRHAVTDPLAWLAGRQERARLLQRVSGTKP